MMTDNDRRRAADVIASVISVTADEIEHDHREKSHKTISRDIAVAYAENMMSSVLIDLMKAKMRR